MVKVNPRQARAHAEALGRRAKTGRVDAAMPGRPGTLLAPLVRPLIGARPNEGTAPARRALIKDRVAAQNRQKNLTIALGKRQSARRLEQISKKLAAVDAERDRLVKAGSGLVARFQSRVSIPGIGAATAFARLIETPELGTLESRPAASLAAPLVSLNCQPA